MEPVLVIPKQYRKKGRKKRRTLRQEGISERSKWIRSTRKLWGKIIIARDRGICQRCGRPGNQPHHIIHRGTAVNPGWFDLKNGVCLCAGCHVWHGAHATSFRDQQAFNEWVRGWLERRGVDYDDMEMRYNSRSRMNVDEIKITYDLLKINV